VLTLAIEDQDAAPETPGSADDEPQYTFEGFVVEFSTKVMLVAPAPPRDQRAGSRSAAHG
jgi:hypothetical protein